MALRLCFVAHNASGALAGDARAHAGGIERQQALMANWLANRGHAVSMISWAPETAAASDYDGPVRQIRMCRKSGGLPILRFFHPRWSSLIRALRDANADIYYYNCGDGCLGQLAMWTARNDRKLVYSVASDVDCEPTFANLSRGYDRWLYRYGLLRATSIVVQTRKQAALLTQHFGRDSTVLAMPSDGCEADSPRLSASDRILWVGRISPEKRPHWVLELARRFPNLTFDVVGDANRSSDYAKNFFDEAKSVANVQLHGRVPYSEISQYFANARLLCSTSVFEGFPNVFLEAWSIGVPVVATCDPDSLIHDKGLGVFGQTIDELESGIRRLLDSGGDYGRASDRARQYFESRHRTESAMQAFENHFAIVAGSGQ